MITKKETEAVSGMGGGQGPGYSAPSLLLSPMASSWAPLPPSVISWGPDTFPEPLISAPREGPGGGEERAAPQFPSNHLQPGRFGLCVVWGQGCGQESASLAELQGAVGRPSLSLALQSHLSHRWATDDQRGLAVYAKNSVGGPRQGWMQGPCRGWAEARVGWWQGWECCVVTVHVCREQGV